ncbi:F-box domain containing protein [Lasiodiplodia theobromae]|uniref:F-box domain containing protein n=1 Tax=Lasiodiplodia theobromae TaxID=45133 RepID=UPI0015C37DF7|nr:F-box domain containing protein [Lasiodiplodia theobromae]KAF4540271.1 F-box domain containing protein [Lasiodiplodia theobromae]
MQPFHCTAPAYSRPQSEVTAAPSSLPLAFRPPTASRNDARLAAIAHWSAQWHNGHLFLRDPIRGYIEISPQVIPPQSFFNDSTYHDKRSDVWLSQVEHAQYLYTVREDHGILAFKVQPQTARPTLPAPEAVLGKRALSSELSTPPPPPKKTRATVKHAGPTRIRKDRRVQTPVYDDVWKRIFELSDPAMLFTYERVNKAFRGALATYSHIWKNSMVDHFGEDLPETPKDLQDRQYADLLSGQGCMSCKEPKARKTYWAFLRRWCTKCFSEKVIKQEDCFAINRKFPGILECIPCATVDSWNHYSYAGWGDENGRSTASGNQPVFLKDDVSAVAAAYEEFMRTLDEGDLSDEEKEEKRAEWIKERREKAKEVMDERLEIDKFEKKWIAARAQKSVDLKNMRKEFIIRRAKNLNPPMCEEVLKLIPAFQENIKINKEFKTEKFWKVLMPKLEEARPQAERLYAMETRANEIGYWDLMPGLQNQTNQMSTCAAGAYHQLMALVEASLKRVHNLGAHSKVQIPHQEFALRVLNMVRRSWPMQSVAAHSQIPDRSPFIDCYPRDGRYVLTIEHACRIYERKIVPNLEGLYPEFRQPTRNVQKFKCPGCKRNDVSKQRTFRQLMNHIREDHATTIGDFQIFRLAGFRSEPYFCAVPWPINLPALTDKQKSTGTWDKDSEPEYGTVDTSAEQPQDILQSAFARKDVCAPESLPNATSKGPADFVGNVRDALRILEGTGLSAPVRSKIVIEYADRQCKKADGKDASLDWHTLRFEVDAFLMSSNNHDILDKMCCGVCRRATDGKTRGGKNYARMPSSRAELIRHFGTHHQSNVQTWPRDMFTLPSDEDVTRALSEASAEANKAFHTLFPDSKEPPKRELVGMDILATVANQQQRFNGPSSSISNSRTSTSIRIHIKIRTSNRTSKRIHTSSRNHTSTSRNRTSTSLNRTSTNLIGQVTSTHTSR